MDEAEFIAALAALPLHDGAQGLSDDAALLSLGGETLILTHDMIVAGVHYLADEDPYNIAWRLIATNLSDLAAKGAQPVGVMLGAMLVPDMARFVQGLRAILHRYDVPLLGGDTVSGGRGAASFGCTAIGRATALPVPVRSGARAGDRLILVGAIGAARLGHHAILNGIDAPEMIAAYRRPLPLLDEGRALAPHAHAMMDVSDGLLLDAQRMAEASGVTLAIELAALMPALADDPRITPFDWHAAASWGDDYALLAAIDPAVDPATLPGRAIGWVRAAAEAPVLVDGAAPIGPLGYRHHP